jgi:hypothetical protein
MSNEYGDIATLKSMMDMASADTTANALLTQALASASRGIDRITGRRFWLDEDPVQRTFNPQGRTQCQVSGELLLVDDIGSIAGLVVETGSGDVWTPVTDFETSPDNALLDGRPVTALRLLNGCWGTRTTRVRITAKWGWPAVPEEIVQAALIQASRLYKRKDSPEGVMGNAEWGTVRLSRHDPDVMALLAPFQRPMVA